MSRQCSRAVALILIFGNLIAPLRGDRFSFTGECVGVHDGDTIRVMHKGREVKIRLEGIDCPELGQDFGQNAKMFTSRLLFAKPVTVRVITTDRYGRLVARVSIDGLDGSVELVKAGLAWHLNKLSRDRELAKAEQAARNSKRGLWSHHSPIPPWLWRNRSK